MRKHSVLSFFFYLRSKILTFSPLDGHTPLPMHKKMWWPYLGFFLQLLIFEKAKCLIFSIHCEGAKICAFSPLYDGTYSNSWSWHSSTPACFSFLFSSSFFLHMLFSYKGSSNENVSNSKSCSDRRQIIALQVYIRPFKMKAYSIGSQTLWVGVHDCTDY